MNIKVTIDMRSQRGASPGRSPAALVILLAAMLAGCEVTNPGPVQDEFLVQPEAHQAVVNGAGRRLSQAISSIGYSSAFAAREILPGGQTGNGGRNPTGQAGALPAGDVGGEWENAQQARWIAEDAIKRFTAAGVTASPAVLTQAYLWAGFANRVLGENMCEAVFDGGPKQANAEYFKRAIAHFDKAIATAPNTAAGNIQKAAAYGGRASAKMWLKDWTGAVSDANLVPAGFQFGIARAIEDVATEGDDLFYANANSPYRGYTIWRTWFESYFDQYKDPRAGYAKDARFPLAQQQLSGYGAVPWSFQTKFRAGTDPVRLTSAREMQLIKAEAALTAGDWQGAMALINGIRTTVEVAPGQRLTGWTAGNATEAWTFLKRERGIELWLEARRLGDIRRWSESNIPGALDWPNFEAISALFRNNPPSKCFPIPDSEIDTNENF
jgi:hypothetical protein